MHDIIMPRSHTIVYTAGVFDLFHPAHILALKRSRSLGDVLVVGVVTDEGCIAYKGKYPLLGLSHRLAQVQACRYVDFAIPQMSTDPTRELEVIRPDIFTHGDDWEHLKKGKETLERLGIEFVRFPYTKGVSSTLIRERIMENICE
jgi:glycerol-3-phosphate cytidylyltransferase